MFLVLGLKVDYYALFRTMIKLFKILCHPMQVSEENTIVRRANHEIHVSINISLLIKCNVIRNKCRLQSHIIYIRIVHFMKCLRLSDLVVPSLSRK